MTSEAETTRAAEQYEAVAAAVAARCLQVPGPIDRGTPLSLLGLDSLRAIELAAELERAVGRTLPEELLDGCADVRALGARLHRICTRQPEAAPDPYDLMHADARLPEEIRPARRARGSTALADARQILLTGATGFLGAAVARDVLERTGADLVCVARPGPGGSAATRINGALRRQGVCGDAIDRRVRAVAGDLSRPRLGLDPAAFAAIATEVDAVCHAGAVVNWATSYAGLRAANVMGTIELLRLACVNGLPFHFVSSLSTCYSTRAAGEIDERYDPLPGLRGVHLGYAQTKVVGEALVGEAGRRGLPVRIYRPALISGDSRTGAFNRDDLLSTLIRGCVHMGAAPDLDWPLDAIPLEAAARAILDLSGAPGRTFHLAHPRPRHWRECVLWMRLYGYPLRLVPYPAWLRLLDLETGSSSAKAMGHPLRALRGFFLSRPAGANGLTVPELYEQGRRPPVSQRRTMSVLQGAAWSCPPLDAPLLDTYFAAFIGAGELRPPAGHVPRPPAPAAAFDREFFSRVTALDVRDVRAMGTGSDHSIVSELAAWRARRATGLFRFRLDVNTATGRRVRRVIVKSKPRDADVIDAGLALASICDPAVGQACTRWQSRLGLTGSHARELAVYTQPDPRFARHAPGVLAAVSDPERDTWVLVLEEIADGSLMDTANQPEAWTRPALAVAIDGLAVLHAIWYGREPELEAAPWIGHVPTAATMAEMRDLWTALAHHASPAFSPWADPDITAIQEELIRTIERWWPWLDAAPRTLIHRDFNPRNICLRGTGPARRLCAYDWELATIGAPQRDLAELLCFVLPPDVDRGQAQAWVNRHRARLERAAARPVDAAMWQAGFHAALYDLLIDRLATYALIHRVRPQRFLPRVVRTWRRLYELFPPEACR